MHSALGGGKRKFKPTLKLSAYFASKTCAEMSKQQKLEARIAEGAKAIKKDKKNFDEQRKAKREREAEQLGGYSNEANPWNDPNLAEAFK